MLRVISIGGITGAVLLAGTFGLIAVMASGVIMGGPGVSNEKLLLVVLVGIAVGLLSGVAVSSVIAVFAKNSSGWLVGLITGFILGSVSWMLLGYYAQNEYSRQHSPMLDRETVLIGLLAGLCCALIGLLVGAIAGSIFKLWER